MLEPGGISACCDLLWQHMSISGYDHLQDQVLSLSLTLSSWGVLQTALLSQPNTVEVPPVFSTNSVGYLRWGFARESSSPTSFWWIVHQLRANAWDTLEQQTPRMQLVSRTPMCVNPIHVMEGISPSFKNEFQARITRIIDFFSFCTICSCQEKKSDNI